MVVTNTGAVNKDTMNLKMHDLYIRLQS